MKVRKFLTILLTLAMVITLLPTTAFAAKNTATTMRLAKTKGTVTVTNASGKAVTQTDNMKLYNGYKLKTGAKSYAWISLDDEKAVRLDTNSAVEVQKSGKALTLYLSSGNIFFNVKDPLKSDESFMVRTSTMTTGIRGTSGCVRVIGPRVTEIHLLTGELEVYVEHPGLDIHDYKVLKAGQKARSMIAEYSMAEVGRQAAIVIEKLDAHEVCGICAEEISRSIALQNRMILEGGFTIEDVERIVAEHDERLEHAEAVADAKQAVIEQKVDEQVFPEDVDPYFEEEEKSSGGSFSGGGSAAPPAENEPETPPEENEPETPPGDSGELEEADLTRQVGSEAELLDALDEYNALAGTMEIILTNDITMDSNALNELMMERNGGKAALTIDTAGHTLTLAAAIENYGDLTITGGGNISVAGDTAIVNNGTLKLDNTTVSSSETAAIINREGAAFEMTSGAISSNYMGLMNEGTATISGGSITANDGAEIGDTVGIANYGSLTVTGNAVISSNGVAIENFDGAEGYSLRGSRASAANGVVNMTGGSITVNGEWATGIRNYSENSQILISGGTINVQNGYGIDAYYGSVNMTDGTINVGASSCGITTRSEFGPASIEEGEPTIILDGTAAIHVNGENATGIYLMSDKVAEIRGGTITVSAAEAVGIENQSGAVNFVTNAGENSWTIKVTDGAGMGLFSSAYIDGERVDTRDEKAALEAMVDATAPGVAILWPQE